MINYRFKYKTGIKKFFFYLGFGMIILFFTTIIVYLLWNAILPQVTSASEITFWQAMGILILSKLLFGSMRFGNHGSRRPISQFRNKWHNISEEEKRALKEKWRARCNSKSEE